MCWWLLLNMPPVLGCGWYAQHELHWKADSLSLKVSSSFLVGSRSLCPLPLLYPGRSSGLKLCRTHACCHSLCVWVPRCISPAVSGDPLKPWQSFCFPFPTDPWALRRGIYTSHSGLSTRKSLTPCMLSSYGLCVNYLPVHEAASLLKDQWHSDGQLW